MKNLTEFPGFLLRRASAVRREKLQELLAAAKAQGGDKADAEAPAAPEASTSSAESTDSASDAGDTSAETSETPEVVAAADESKSDNTEASADASDEAKAEASDKPDDASASADKPDSDKQASDKPASDADLVDEEALAAAVGETMKIADERLVYLMGALKAVGRKGIDKVRQVRVFKGEEAPSGAFSIDDLHFVVDRLAAPAKKSSPGGKGRGNKGREDKGRGGGGGGKPGGAGFSSKQGGRGFDSMARDERPGDVPSGGLGWSLERAPGSDKDNRGGKGKPRRKGGPRRGKPGDKPGGGRKPRANKPMPEVIVKAPTIAPSDK